MAILVILSHAFDAKRLQDPLARLFHTVSFGAVAVDCFFILSGYLIAMSFENSPSAPNFICNRVLRIYPGFLLAFFITVFVVGLIGAVSGRAYLHALQPAALLQSAVTLTSPITPRTFANSPDTLVNKSMWTIHLEFICYLLMLGLGVAKILRQKYLVILLFAAALISFTLFRHLPENAGVSGAVYGDMGVSLLRLTPMFLAGAVMYKTRWYRIRPRWLIACAAIVLGVGLCNRFTAEPAIATIGAYLMMVAGTAGIRPKFFQQSPDMSYGIYLYGGPGLKLASLVPALATPEETFALALIFASGMALVSWYAVEYPSMKLKKTNFLMHLGRKGPK